MLLWRILYEQVREVAMALSRTISGRTWWTPPVIPLLALETVLLYAVKFLHCGGQVLQQAGEIVRSPRPHLGSKAPIKHERAVHQHDVPAVDYLARALRPWTVNLDTWLRARVHETRQLQA